MEALIAITLVGAVAALAGGFGTDSRSWDDREPRRWWPGRLS